jgi:cyd operon protein YbgT
MIIMRFSIAAADSLIVWTATLSRLTLQITFLAVQILLPIVLLDTTWVYRVMRGRVSAASVENDLSLYWSTRRTGMWYFTWILGIGVALAFGIINAMWLEGGAGFDSDRSFIPVAAARRRRRSTLCRAH